MSLDDRKPMKRTPMRQRSKKRERQMRTRRVPEVRRLVEENAPCQVCPVLSGLGIRTHCAGRVEGLHERRKSSSGGSRVNPANLVPSCNWGNSLIECEPELIRNGSGTALIVREGDPEWLELGSRHDRMM